MPRSIDQFSDDSIEFHLFVQHIKSIAFTYTKHFFQFQSFVALSGRKMSLCWLYHILRYLLPCSLSIIRAESVGPLRCIYQRLTPLPIFNADSSYSGMDATVEHNIDTRGWKGKFCSETKSKDYNSISQWTKTSY